MRKGDLVLLPADAIYQHAEAGQLKCVRDVRREDHMLMDEVWSDISRAGL
jgi:hypothetical protein